MDHANHHDGHAATEIIRLCRRVDQLETALEAAESRENMLLQRVVVADKQIDLLLAEVGYRPPWDEDPTDELVAAV